MSHKHETLSTTSSNSNGNLNKQMDDITQSQSIELNKDYESMDVVIHGNLNVSAQRKMLILILIYAPICNEC